MKKIYDEYCQIPILGFNSGKYDVTFIISHMLKFPISNFIATSSYMKLMYRKWSFLDCRNYVPPGINLSKFAEMWGVSNEKEIMCYTQLNCEAKLDYPELPPIETFDNALTGKKCSIEDYQIAQNNWNKWNCKLFKDYLIKYCEIDVDIMMQAVTNYRKVYLEENQIELLNYVSLSQTAYTTFLKKYHNKQQYPLFTISNEKVYNIINKNIYSGNCQVFKKYAKVGENNI